LVRTIAEDHEKKREAILNVAAAVFADTGFDRASMNQIARECGISKAAIYHYYDSKDALLFDVLDRHMDNLIGGAKLVCENAAGPEKKLYRLIEAILLLYHGADHQHRAQVSASNSLSSQNHSLHLEKQRELVKMVSEVILAINPYKFEKNSDLLHSVTMSLFGALNWFYMWNSRKGIQPRKDYAKQLCDMIVNGIKSP